MASADSASPSTPSRSDAVTAAAALVIAYGAYLAIFLPLIPASGVGLGHDYALHLPNLLAGTFFFRANGLWQLPWFNPGQCGGVPFFADLNVAYYSLPQFLSFIVDPLNAVRIAFAIFAAIGGLGMYALARSRFGASRAAAVTAAVLFLFNGFFVYRMAIGHITFHPVMLAPWLMFVALPPRDGYHAMPFLLAATLGGIILAYMFQAGMVHAIVPLVLASALVILAHGLATRQKVQPWIVLAASGVVAILLSSARLVAGLSFLGNFPRSDYPLPGFADWGTSLRFALESVFWLPPVDAGFAALTNKMFALQQHEWEYGVGPAAAVLIVAGLLALVAAWAAKAERARRFMRAVPVAIAFVVVLALPVALNWYEPAWNEFLKRVPLLEASSTLLRWFVLYVPLAALFAGLSVDRVVSIPARPFVMLALLVLVVAMNALTDKRFYQLQAYDAAPITGAWHRPGVVPITALVKADSAAGSHSGNNAIAAGQSEIDCYQPMFGYKLEHYNASNLHPGPVTDVDAAGNLNLKNPACYVFPGENQCAPGALFSAAAESYATALTNYLAYGFAMPLRQQVAGWVNVAAIAGCLLVLATTPVRRRRRPSRLDANPRPG